LNSLNNVIITKTNVYLTQAYVSVTYFGYPV